MKIDSTIYKIESYEDVTLEEVVNLSFLAGGGPKDVINFHVWDNEQTTGLVVLANNTVLSISLDQPKLFDSTDLTTEIFAISSQGIFYQDQDMMRVVIIDENMKFNHEDFRDKLLDTQPKFISVMQNWLMFSNYEEIKVFNLKTRSYEYRIKKGQLLGK